MQVTFRNDVVPMEVELFRRACEIDLEDMVAKRKDRGDGVV